MNEAKWILPLLEVQAPLGSMWSLYTNETLNYAACKSQWKVRKSHLKVARNIQDSLELPEPHLPSPFGAARDYCISVSRYRHRPLTKLK